MFDFTVLSRLEWNVTTVLMTVKTKFALCSFQFEAANLIFVYRA